jgi:hypothetical protein
MEHVVTEMACGFGRMRGSQVAVPARIEPLRHDPGTAVASGGRRVVWLFVCGEVRGC